jgi:hypothetical protein
VNISAREVVHLGPGRLHYLVWYEHRGGVGALHPLLPVEWLCFTKILAVVYGIELDKQSRCTRNPTRLEL